MPRKKELKAKSDGVDVATKIIIKKAKDIDKKMIKKEKDNLASTAENKTSRNSKAISKIEKAAKTVKNERRIKGEKR